MIGLSLPLSCRLMPFSWSLMPLSWRLMPFSWRLLLLSGVSLLILSGCAPQVIQPAKPVTIPSQNIPIVQPSAVDSLQQQAEAARQAGNDLETERLYTILARNAQYANRNQAWMYVAQSSLRNKHPLSTLDALNEWAKLEPTAMSTPTWQDLWAESITHVPASDSIRQATPYSKNTATPLGLRAMSLATLWLIQPQIGEPVPNLANLYAKADNAGKILLEQRTASIIRAASTQELDTLYSAIPAAPTPEGETPATVEPLKFPWTIIVLEALHREKGKQGPQVDALLARLQNSNLLDKSLLNPTLTPAQSIDPAYLPVPASKVPYSSGCYALALPMSGDFASIGRKVASGAEVAKAELSQAGHRIELKTLNTENPSWLDELAALPPQCVMVGGPLRQATYATAKDRGLLRDKAFFTFMSRLDGTDEGQLAWRFFSSPADQVTALLRFGTELGISNYATLTPLDAYGQRMSELFASTATSSQYFVQQNSYDLGSDMNLSRLMGELVGVRMQSAKKPIPSSSFQALFLPDSWKNINQVIPYLFFQGEDRLVLMGTALWEQGLGRQNNIQNMDLAIFPGSWNPNPVPGSAAANLISYFSQSSQEAPDFWTSLGYDFVRFASALNIQSMDPITINTRLQIAQDLNWSMAPLRWQAGQATQYMFIFRPTTTGFELVNFADFKTKRDTILARFARRVRS